MSREPSSNLADLARALACLRPADDATREAIAALVLKHGQGEGVDSKSKRVEQPPPPPSPPPSQYLPPPPAPPGGPPVNSSAGTEEPVPAVVTRIRRARPRLPQWVLAAPPLPAPAPAGTTSPAPESLLAPRRSRAVLGAMLATPGEGPVDLEAVVRLISSGRALGELPLRPVPTLAHGVQLLVDHGEAMLPFHLDAAGLEHELSLLVGEGLELLHFVACPSRGCGRGARHKWKPYGPGQAPRPGARVLCVTDLGLGAVPVGEVPAQIEEWRDFALMLRRAGCSVGALVPYPPERWPSGLERVMELFYWDRTLTVARAARGLSRRA